MATKYCSRCDCTKPVSEFCKDRSTKSGLSARCKSCRSEYGKSWYYGSGRARRRAGIGVNKERKREYQAEYGRRNADRLREQKRQWIADNIDRHRANTRRNMRKRRATTKGRLENNVSRAVHRALKGRKNGEPAFVLLGFTVEQLISHLERQFYQGMTWGNYGKWHVDHIRPLASFTYSEPTDPDFKRAWAITNLRPLWAAENISKGARVSLLI